MREKEIGFGERERENNGKRDRYGKEKYRQRDF